MRTGRRDFLKTVAVAGAAAQSSGAAPESPQAPAGDYPRVYTGAQLRMLAFPLGGIGAGSISLGGRGQFRDWEIFNKPDKGRRPKYGFSSIRVQTADQPAVSMVLESQLTPPYEGASGLGSDNVPGLPRFQSARFTGEYPLARIDFEDARVPVSVALEAFTPFIPLDADASGLPVAVLRYRVSNTGKKRAIVSIAFSLDNPVGEAGRACQFRSGNGLEGLSFTNPFQAANAPLAGSFVVAALSAPVDSVTYLRGWGGGGQWHSGALLFWDDFTADGALGPEGEGRDNTGSLCIRREIAPGAEAAFTFLLAWRFPNRTAARSGWTAVKGDENTVLGNYYATRFNDAWAAAEYTAAHLETLEARTRAFAGAMRRTTLPAAVRDGAMSNLSTLVTQTSFRTADGKFHGFEGCNDQSGCCFGSCTHVWNYETATAHLFPTLSRSLRETSFGFSTDAMGHMDFREVLPSGKDRFGTAAADGQMGQIMHLYLDWRLSGDTAWLRSQWPAAKRAIEYAWVAGGWDANRDGVMEGVQHNTYDVEFLGPNPLCGVWYLGALRAAEEMARVVGDADAASEYRKLFDHGSRWIDANLFNGEYYIQKIQGIPRDQIAKGLLLGAGARDTSKPDYQMGNGCLIDQLLGQYMAGLSGLGLLLDADHIRKTAASLYRYNYKRRLDQHESVQRVYALNDEAALVICDYGKGARPKVPFPYFAEVMTGFEYAAAVLMIQNGMVSEGIECIANIRRRYDGERRNPWNEAECGHHYARAMASWSALPALSGFAFHAADQKLEIRPRVNAQRFSSFWSTGLGWGEFTQEMGAAKRLTFSVAEGSLSVRDVALDWLPTHAELNGRSLAFAAEGARIMLKKAVTVPANGRLTFSA